MASGESCEPEVTVTFVHGTFARGVFPFRRLPLARWTENGHLRRMLEVSLNVRFGNSPTWSGANSFKARSDARERIASALATVSHEHPGALHFVVAHSHGGTAAIRACADPAVQRHVAGIICLGTPFPRLQVKPLFRTVSRKSTAALLCPLAGGFTYALMATLVAVGAFGVRAAVLLLGAAGLVSLAIWVAIHIPPVSFLARRLCNAFITRAHSFATDHSVEPPTHVPIFRIPRTKSGRPHAIPLNATVLTTLQALYTERKPDCPYVFAHATGRKAGEPVKDVKNGFRTALEIAKIKDFTWHDLRHTFASWLIMKGASLRSVAELLGHRGLRMVMRYAHLSPAYLSSEVGLLDAPAPTPPPLKPHTETRARKGQRAATPDQRTAKVVEFPSVLAER